MPITLECENATTYNLSVVLSRTHFLQPRIKRDLGWPRYCRILFPHLCVQHKRNLYRFRNIFLKMKVIGKSFRYSLDGHSDGSCRGSILFFIGILMPKNDGIRLWFYQTSTSVFGERLPGLTNRKQTDRTDVTTRRSLFAFTSGSLSTRKTGINSCWLLLTSTTRK